MARSLLIGALGQVGSELAGALIRNGESETLILADLPAPPPVAVEMPYVRLDVLDAASLQDVVTQYRIDTIYLLAATLSARGEESPLDAWQLNIAGLMNVLQIAALRSVRVFWPSSIAVFGPSSPKHLTPQHGPTEPTTVYGISKLAGEGWCNWFRVNRGVDVRSLRYPGLISHGAPPGGGTTDYAVDVFQAAVSGHPYTCFLAPNTRLPMMYMPDAVRATVELMNAPSNVLRCSSAYNIAGISFTPAEVADEIRRTIPDFRINYEPDRRQAIADTWPESMLDEVARKEWGWRPKYDLASMVVDMLAHVKHKAAGPSLGEFDSHGLNSEEL